MICAISDLFRSAMNKPLQENHFEFLEIPFDFYFLSFKKVPEIPERGEREYFLLFFRQIKKCVENNSRKSEVKTECHKSSSNQIAEFRSVPRGCHSIAAEKGTEKAPRFEFREFTGILDVNCSPSSPVVGTILESPDFFDYTE